MIALQWKSCATGAASLRAFLERVRTCSEFSGIPNTPLSDPRLMLVTTVSYLIVIFSLRRICGGGGARFSRSPLFVIAAAGHNLFLSLLSLVMNIGTTLAILDVWDKTGELSETICSHVPGRSFPSQFQFWMYAFFVSKYYELVDTVIQVLRGRPLTLLHVWHHSSVMYEAWSWLQFRMTIGIYGVWFNTLVHVIMYAYYAAVLLKVRFPLKKAITSLQIVQFVCSFMSLIPFTYLHVNGPGCTGIPALALSAFTNGSYLFLFIRFFKKAYSPQVGRKKQ